MFRTKYLFLLLGMAIVLIFGVFLYHALTQPALDDDIKAFFAKYKGLQVYTQEVSTEMLFPDRIMRIDGIYTVDTPQQQFSAHSTTTLEILGGGISESMHTFFLDHIALPNDVYVRLQTNSDLLKQTIPHAPQWKHFSSDSIPETFANIVVPGPILDNARVFDNDGTYLTLSEKESVVHQGESLSKYTFHLSKEAHNTSAGPLHALSQRIGSGVVELFIDTDQNELALMRFSNETYTSTTTISRFNEAIELTAPFVSEQ